MDDVPKASPLRVSRVVRNRRRNASFAVWIIMSSARVAIGSRAVSKTACASFRAASSSRIVRFISSMSISADPHVLPEEDDRQMHVSSSLVD